MTTASNFIDTLLGFAPLVSIIAFVATALWLINKIAPEFVSRAETKMDEWFGVDNEYDERYSSGRSFAPDN